MKLIVFVLFCLINTLGFSMDDPSCDNPTVDFDGDGEYEFSAGDGSEFNPFIVCDAKQLRSLDNLYYDTRSKLNYVRLGRDIDLAGYEHPGEEGLGKGFCQSKF